MKKRTKVSVFVLTFMLVISMLPTFANAQIVKNGTYKLVNVNSGLPLSVEKGALWNGAKIVQGSTIEASCKKWKIMYLGADGGGQYYRIVNVNSGKNLDVPNNTRTPGVQLQQWGFTGDYAQQWYVKSEPPYTSTIWFNRGNDLVLDVNRAATYSGASVIQWYWSCSNNQRWLLYYA